MNREIKRTPVCYTDSPSMQELAVITVDVPSTSVSDIKKAIECEKSGRDNELFIDRPCSMYDCTGKAFTSRLNRIHRSLENTMDGWKLITVYMHTISLDV